MSTERDELARIIYRVNNRAYGDYGHHEDTADAILAAGWRKPRTVTTVDELRALPDGTVVMWKEFDDEVIAGVIRDGWMSHTDRNYWNDGFDANVFPVHVLWTPGEP